MASDAPAVGIVFANVLDLGTAEGAVALAEACERHGVESVWTVEHIVVPADYRSTYPYSPDGRMPGGEDSPIPDPLIWLTWVAAHSSRLTLGTGVLILPLRNPAILAKELATLDQLSGGRVQLGVGVGWLEEEFDALGVPFASRGRRTDEHVAALRALWNEPEPSYHGEFVAFERALSHPKPTRSIPIHIGGHTAAAARRAGRIGDGFFPVERDRLAELVDVMRASAEAAGRDPDTIEITTSASRSPEGRRRLADLGVRRVVVPPPALTPDAIDASLARLMDQLVG